MKAFSRPRIGALMVAGFLMLIACTSSLAQQREEEKREGKALLVNINTAPPEELQKLPGVGPAIAGRIIRHRQKHGRFRRVEELLVIRGISRNRFDALRPHVTIADTSNQARTQGEERERR